MFSGIHLHAKIYYTRKQHSILLIIALLNDNVGISVEVRTQHSTYTP